MSAFNQKKPLNGVPVQAAKPAIPSSESLSSLIGKTLHIIGEVISDDEVVIEGKIEGKINVKNRVIIGKNGSVEAEIQGQDIIIKGKAHGDVKATRRVEIVPEGILNGNISSPKIVIAEGAIFDGSIDMKAVPSGKPTVIETKSTDAAPPAGGPSNPVKPL
jgi:cytoskeletal protein CcmA (bactofilin family)